VVLGQSAAMEQLNELIVDLGGAAPKRLLVAHGATDRLLTAAVRSGVVHRARRGWYTVHPPGDPRHEAIRIGGRLSGTALLALSGAWLWSEPPVTVVVPSNASRLRPRHGATVVWRAPRARLSSAPADAVPPWADSFEEALVQAVLELPFDEAVALLDWTLVTGRLTRAELSDAFAGVPASQTAVLDWVDPASESFIESLVRATFGALGHSVTVQVSVAAGDARRIDVVVDDVAAIELDGRAFHADSFDRDREKDIAVVMAGRISLRCGYRMVRDERENMIHAVHALLRRTRAVSLAARRCRRTGHAGCLRGQPWRVPAARAPRRPVDSGRVDPPVRSC
jgi:hypothetical protein